MLHHSMFPRGKVFISLVISILNKSVEYRIVFITVLVFGCLNHWHWKASIISHLSIILPETPFDSLQGLIDSPYQITTLGDTYLSKVWFEADDDSSLLKAIANTKFLDKDASLKKTEQEAIAQTMTDLYALFFFNGVGINLQEYKDCKLDDVGFPVSKINLAFAFPKTSPYRDIFNHGLQKMMESGEIDRIRQKHKPEARICGGGGKGKTLGFKNIILVFLILGLGLLLSIVSLVVEIVINLHKQAHN